MASEFDLIRRHFVRATPGTALGPGDDCALIAPSAGMQLAVTTDMLVAGTHFFADTDACDLGWKTAAVNLSDLAAMGAQPRWLQLALSLPTADDAWIDAFARGFFDCAQAFGAELAGGDTTRGPLTLCVTAIGEVPPGQALRRSGAVVGDDVWVSGQPGLAALGLAHLQGRIELSEPTLTRCLAALHRPQPRVALGMALRGLAHAAIDVSDGFLADLGHILEASGVGAQIDLGTFAVAPPGVDATLARDCQLAGGDDYELVFTAAPDARPAIESLGRTLGLPLARCGRIVDDAADRLVVRGSDGQIFEPTRRGYDHFAQNPP